MFKRRIRRRFWQRVKQWVYPSMGIRRALRYWRYRTIRLPGTPDSIARGLACGAAVSFTPFVGLHVPFSLLVAWTMGGNMVAAVVGTIVGNPFTLLFIWGLIYKVGTWMLAMPSDLSHVSQFFSIAVRKPETLPSALPDLFQPVVLPMLLGSVPVSLLVWGVTYWVTRGIVAEYRLLRSGRLKLVRKKRKDATMTEE